MMVLPFQPSDGLINREVERDCSTIRQASSGQLARFINSQQL
jgi:hypothetical protein